MAAYPGGTAIDVRLITEDGVEQHSVADLPALLRRPDGIVWVDVPVGDTAAATVLADVFGFHPMAVRDCLERNRVPKVHVYPDHVFVVLHAPEQGRAGHVHFIELDQFVGPRYVVTVHGPVNPAVDPQVCGHETRQVLRRLESGRLRPRSPFELSYAIVSALARRQEAFVELCTGEVWRLEQQVTSGELGDTEQFLEELFRTRHGLAAVRAMAMLSREIYGRLASLGRMGTGWVATDDDRRLLDDLIDQFDRVRGLAQGQADYLQGVIEFYRTRTDTKMTIAAERLAVIAVITLPITALSSIYGMNLIVNRRTDIPQLALVLAVMIAMSVTLLRWAKRQGWW
ncbi:magnesium transporter CorA family protein [Catellatospora tritici]|uniref:magnesium transporter CorA family protein n=1 Tax=Catellatospora tritici TaxID=2851566 RepID=UPI0020C56BC5|nr:magnesium transporter CorA family protein [Catellatospora tritici]